MDPLTAQQARVFEFICRRTEDEGYGPTIREIAEEMNFKSPNGVMCHLRAIEKKGYIERTNHKSRSIILTQEAREARYGMPLAGVVSAGALMETFEQEEKILLEDFWNHRNSFALRVEGESMIEAHIQSGDIVIVQKKRSANRGDIVVARTGEGETTMKYWYPEKNRIRLQPANKDMKPIYSKNAKVIGVVVGVIRQV